ncbi:MAG: helix-turn-helix domain-containing protein [Zoogloeaceae bacterium]|jgi:hypothetical protein|nr:helix-turn-helix domain-containing protein [Zoogloeaceae bacterium]
MTQTQCEAILERLQRAPITPLEALEELGIFRLGGRIYDLKRQGHRIISEMVEVTNRHGKPCHVARYSLEAEVAHA